jgi:Ca2+-binding RTX toxin-like protein
MPGSVNKKASGVGVGVVALVVLTWLLAGPVHGQAPPAPPAQLFGFEGTDSFARIDGHPVPEGSTVAAYDDGGLVAVGIVGESLGERFWLVSVDAVAHPWVTVRFTLPDGSQTPPSYAIPLASGTLLEVALDYSLKPNKAAMFFGASSESSTPRLDGTAMAPGTILVARNERGVLVGGTRVVDAVLPPALLGRSWIVSLAADRATEVRFATPASSATPQVEVRRGSFTEVAIDVVSAPYCHNQPATILGTAGVDLLTGTGGRDVIVGLEGDDTIDGAGGDDLICGGPGADSLSGGPGSDRIRGDAGENLLDGGSGDDSLLGGPDDDTILGGPGNDLLQDLNGNDLLDGGSGDDILLVFGFLPQANVLLGGHGDDRLVGSASDDVLDAGPGSDVCEPGLITDALNDCEVVIGP